MGLGKHILIIAPSHGKIHQQFFAEAGLLPGAGERMKTAELVSAEPKLPGRSDRMSPSVKGAEWA